MKKLAIVLTLFMFIGTATVSVAAVNNVSIEKREGDDKKKKKKCKSKKACCAKKAACKKGEAAGKSCPMMKKEGETKTAAE